MIKKHNQKETETIKTDDLEGNIDIIEENTAEENNESNESNEKSADDETQEDNVISAHEAELEKLNKSLTEENTKLKNGMDTLTDRLLRISAEYDNFRKRTAKEKEGIYNDACSDVLKGILQVSDNLEKAANAEGDIDSLRKGIEMTLRQFNDSLTKLDVEEIPTDIPFDPNLHNAVMHVEDEKLEQNEIVDVFQKGYKRGDKVIRYSMVKVAN